MRLLISIGLPNRDSEEPLICFVCFLSLAIGGYQVVLFNSDGTHHAGTKRLNIVSMARLFLFSGDTGIKTKKDFPLVL